MIYLAIVWILLIIIGYVLGSGLSAWLNSHFSPHQGDHFIYRTWLGLLFLGMVFLLLTVFTPLTPWVGVFTIIILLIFSNRVQPIRSNLSTLWHATPPLNLLGGLCLIIGIAIFNVKHVMLIDAGGYHIPLINWFSNYGAPAGLGLLHPRYGYTSSWFALFAPLNAGIVENRIMSVPGGLALILFFIHICIVGRRVLLNKAKTSDYFILISSIVIFACINLNTNKFQGGFFRSTSPDVPVFILLPFIVWLALVISEQPQGWQAQHYTALVLICAALINIKLSTINAIALVVLAILLMHQLSIKFVIKLMLLGGGGITPSLAYATTVTGCPLYPLPVCFNLPWSLGAAQASAESEVIRIWARWGWWHGPSADTPLYDQIALWAKGEPLAEQFMLLNAIAIVLLVLLAIRQNRLRTPPPTNAPKTTLMIVSYGFISLMFWAYSAPTLRFGLGSLVILPAFCLAQFLNTLNQSIFISAFHKFNKASLSNLGIFIFSVLIGVTFLLQGLSRKADSPDALIKNAMQRGEIAAENYPSWLLPPKIPNGVIAYRPQIQQTLFLAQGLHRYQVNDVQYSSPMPDTEDWTAINQCWALDLMCTTRLGNDDVQLRDAARGISAGFVKAQP